MKVLMLPGPDMAGESGIKRVVEAYYKYLPDYGIEFVGENDHIDLIASHAGMAGAQNDICHCHGLHWTADYRAAEWEWRVNRRVVDAIRHAKQVTVPSAWVAETFQRDMRFTPHVVPHGIEWEDWQHSEANEGYIIWNKNRGADVCDNTPVTLLAERYPDITFASTIKPPRQPSNVKVSGVLSHYQMKIVIQRAGVYLSTTKETFGIGVLEAMAAGVPVLGYAHGGNVDLIEHGVSGYLAKPGDIDDLAEGLNYCLQHRDVLGANGRELAKRWTWEAACEKVAGVYRLALEDHGRPMFIDSSLYED